MSTRWLPLLCALALGGCAHTHTAAPPQAGTGGAGQAGVAPVRKHAPPAGLAETPRQLEKPGAREKIIRALRQKGALQEQGEVSDLELSASVRRFQERHDLAATGYPDDKTLQQLGLKPDEILRTHERQRQARKNHERRQGVKSSGSSAGR